MLHLLARLLLSVARAAPDVVIVVSDDVEAYTGPVDGFRSVVGARCASQVVNLDGDRALAEQKFARLAADPPRLVYAVGAKAAYMAKQRMGDTPIVHAMVFDPARYGVVGNNVTGVSMYVPAQDAVDMLRQYLPGTEVVGVILKTAEKDKPGESRYPQQVADVARAAGMSVPIQRVTNTRDVGPVWKRLAKGEVAGGKPADVLWVLPDPVLADPDTFFDLLDSSRRARIPMVVGKEVLVRAGAFMSIEAKGETVGAQAAQLALRILDEGVRPGDLEVPEPASLRVVINRTTMRKMGIQVDPELLAVTDVVE
jgi:putative ABC transport system substrate-binding protein